VPLYHLDNARTAEQLADMRRLAAAGICVFCPEHLAADPDQRLLYRSAHWTVTPNEFPYGGTRLHLLLVPDEHVGDLVDLSPAAQADFWAALAWVRTHHGLRHYGLGARNGDPRYTGGTIEHLHVHLIVGDVADPEHRGVRMKLSSRPG
jgi:diadenosine tetraphosphate (Ap4A) HIT family hydrolase